jgi:soluble lytic murein transglycosylase-like protein
MDFLAQIQAIETRIQEIEDRFEPPSSAGGNIQTPFQQIFSNYLPQSLEPPVAFPHAGIPKGISSFKDIIEEAGAKFGVDPALISAVIRQESGGNPTVKSSAGAMGLMQLMPATAQALGVSNPFDPRQNIFGGVRYLRGLLDRFGGNISLALAAYNAGPGAVQKYGGVPPYPETQNYVKSILSLYHEYRNEDSKKTEVL